MNRVLVTGANGFIGRALVETLVANKKDVIKIDSMKDIAVNGSLDIPFNTPGITHVFHLAGKTFVPDSWEYPDTFLQTNVVGTLNVLEYCRKACIPITYVSAYIYGQPIYLPINEQALIAPNNPYALTKHLAELTCEFYARVYGLNITIIRPFNVFGVGQRSNFLIPSIISDVLSDKEEVNVKDLYPRRDFIYIKDLIEALLVTQNLNRGFRVYNIGSGISLSVDEVINIIQNEAGTNKKKVCDNKSRSHEILDVFADYSKIKQELGWEPKISFKDGIAEIINYERNKVRL